MERDRKDQGEGPMRAGFGALAVYGAVPAAGTY